MTNKAREDVKAMADRTVSAETAEDAMRFSQAALNLAQADAVMGNTSREDQYLVHNLKQG